MSIQHLDRSIDIGELFYCVNHYFHKVDRGRMAQHLVFTGNQLASTQTATPQPIAPGGWLRELRTLNLSNNSIAGPLLSQGIIPLAYLNNLTTLDLANNRIARVCASWWTGVTALTSLYLQGNHINEIPESSFSSLASLTLLDLSRNRLSTLHSESFKGTCANHVP